VKTKEKQSPTNIWLMKSEPDVFSWTDLLNKKFQVCAWEGVRNYQARNFMRDDFKKEDVVLFYHSSCDEPGIQGIAKVFSETSRLDETALDPNSEYFDRKAAHRGTNPWVLVDIQAVCSFEMPVTLAKIRAEAMLSNMLLVRPGQRLSIQPVSPEHLEIIKRLANF
jgi:predicted RNA-binding protein with PUA-like domain